jgi:exopolysaccharide/PEP-CTERM locus tyrosine autokinase
MGKISDAMERHKKEKTIEAMRIPIGRSESFDKKRIEQPIPSELTVQEGFNPKLVAYSMPDSLDAENFKILRAQILFPKNGNRPRTIMITSAVPGEGKSFVASNLAVSIAMGINEHVLLVDCDFRRPSIHDILGYSNTAGLHDYLTGKGQLSDFIIRTRVKKLSLLTSGSPCSNPSELLSSTATKEFLEEVKGRNKDHFVIIDAPPSQVTAEAGVLANYVDGVILVVMAEKAPRETIQKNMENLGKKKVLGIVFNGYSQGDKFFSKYYKDYYR